ncbi:hypothetical protein KVV02_008196 [Mortierella alpina]|uniref:Uncharacterized protein n=1 Tax=Mortierella alpina TaxID=64518 RepID=A0A9P7ZYQ7_MORAP|nr:hypothetical protein KVV02_008196 [Mortierella alpina]
MTRQDGANDSVLYPHTTNFEGRAPPPDGGYSWQQIRKAIAIPDTNSLHSLRRTDKGQYEYEVWQAGIDRTRYRNVGEYIAFTILKWPDLVDPADEEIAIGQGTVACEERYKTIEPRLTLRLNHYPFPVQESIQYFVLWSTRDMSVPAERDRLDAFLRRQLDCPRGVSKAPVEPSSHDLSSELLPSARGMIKEWMWFVNPIELRSVASVHHLHVFVRDVANAKS